LERVTVETLETLSRTIATAQDLRDIVATMKSLAAVSIRHHERTVTALSTYQATVELGVQAVLRERHALDTIRHERPSGAVCAVVFGSDQGLCGSFNEQIAIHALTDLEQLAPPERRTVIAVGVRAAARLEELGSRVDSITELPSSTSLLTSLVHELLVQLDERDAARHYDRVLLYCNRGRGDGGFGPEREQLLPLSTARIEDLRTRPWPSRALPMVATDRGVVWSALVHQWLSVTIHRALAESLAAENASRLAAMQAAERNIDERLEALHARYHLLRQTSITNELLDIVSGAEALAGEQR
jgi:F-type H+-transporting ATPase subunit gamma